MTVYRFLSQKRFFPIGALLLAVASALGARYGLEGFWAKYLGVALWTVCVYMLLLVVKPDFSVLRASLSAWAISWCVELAQLTPIPGWLSSQHVVLRWIFGSDFSFGDLPVYVFGTGLGVLCHLFLMRLGFSRPVIKVATEE